MEPLLDNISGELKEKLLKTGHVRKFSESQEIFAEGDTAEFLPIVLDGSVKLVRFPEAGKEVIIGMFRSGEAFAIPPAIDGKRFPATAIAMEDSDLLMLDGGDFKTLMSESDEFSSALIERMCGLLRERTAAVQIHSTPSTENRLAAVLLRLASESRQQIPVKIMLRRQDIADIAGLTTETTIRTIRKLADKDLLRIEHGKIYIDALEPLRKFLE